MKEIKVGEIYLAENGGEYKCVKDTGPSCPCALTGEDCGNVACLHLDREDGNDVHFEKVW